MKKVLVLAAAMALFAAPVLAASGTITNSKHDLSALADNLQGQLCVFCHTPHGGSADAPLWNRGVKDMTIYNAYTSTTKNATIDLTVGDAKLCMTCHDGGMTDNLTNYLGSSTAPTETAPGDLSFSGIAAIGADDLTNDHPVGFTYNAALATADGELNDPTTAAVDALLFGTAVGSKDMWCSSCHDVHKPGVLANNDVPFLRQSNAGSNLCLTCHNK